jgi:hypothetical protein
VYRSGGNLIKWECIVTQSSYRPIEFVWGPKLSLENGRHDYPSILWFEKYQQTLAPRGYFVLGVCSLHPTGFFDKKKKKKFGGLAGWALVVLLTFFLISGS